MSLTNNVCTHVNLCAQSCFHFIDVLRKKNHINTVNSDNTAPILTLVIGTLAIKSKMFSLTRDCDSRLGDVVGDQIRPRHQVLKGLRERCLPMVHVNRNTEHLK